MSLSTPTTRWQGESLIALLITGLAAGCSDGASTGDAALTVQSFRMIEFHYEEWPYQFYYAPQLVLKEASGQSGARVFEMNFTVPGLGSFGLLCSNNTFVPAGHGALRFHEVQGYYEVAFESGGHPAAAGEASVAIVFRDDIGRSDTITSLGPITPGELPSTSQLGAVISIIWGRRAVRTLNA